MKNLLITLIILLFSASYIYSQKDMEAKNVLDELNQKIESYENIRIRFTFFYESLQDNSSSSQKGTLVMQGKKYFMDISQATTYCNGSTLWTYLKEAHEVNISDQEMNENDILSNPKKLFTIYEDDFKYVYIGKINEDDIDLHHIDLIPNNLDEDYGRIHLKVNTESGLIHSVKVFFKDGTSYRVTVDEFETNLNLKDDFFEFNASEYPDAEIIDLRW